MEDIQITDKLDDKKIKKIMRLIEKRGMSIVDDDWQDYIVCIDDENGDLVFVDYYIKTYDENTSNDMPVPSRERFEQAMFTFLLKHEGYDECRIRLDMLELILIRKNRAIMRYYVNAKIEAR